MRADPSPIERRGHRAVVQTSQILGLLRLTTNRPICSHARFPVPETPTPSKFLDKKRLLFASIFDH
jgi:hypothetical protein